MNPKAGIPIFRMWILNYPMKHTEPIGKRETRSIMKIWIIPVRCRRLRNGKINLIKERVMG